jgi:hypothetical protein
MKVTASMFNTPEPAINIIRQLEKDKYRQTIKLKQTRSERMEDRMIKELESKQ